MHVEGTGDWSDKKFLDARSKNKHEYLDKVQSRITVTGNQDDDDESDKHL